MPNHTFCRTVNQISKPNTDISAGPKPQFEKRILINQRDRLPTNHQLSTTQLPPRLSTIQHHHTLTNIHTPHHTTPPSSQTKKGTKKTTHQNAPPRTNRLNHAHNQRDQNPDLPVPGRRHPAPLRTMRSFPSPDGPR